MIHTINLKKRITSLLLVFVMVLTMLPSIPLTAFAAEAISYVDKAWNEETLTLTTETKTVTEYSVVTAETTTLTSGWWIVNTDVTFDTRISANGEVHLILCDGKTLTANQGISVNKGNELYIYGQSDDKDVMGKLVSTATYLDAGIGGDSEQFAGKLEFNGGYVKAISEDSNESSAIGSGAYRAGYDIIILGGVIEAEASFGAAIGSGNHFGIGKMDDICNIRIHGGTVTATSTGGAAIGGGCYFSGGNITITGGTVTATSASRGAAIGGGDEGNGGNITITGGTVTAKNTESTWQGGAGIGGGYRGSGGNIVISGGNITAEGGWGASGIGGYADAGNITITGGTVNAKGNTRACGIGGGVNGKTGSITILTPDVTATGYEYRPNIGFGGKDDGTGSSMLLEGTTITVTGHYTLSADYTLPEGYTLVVSEGATLTIPEDVKFINLGSIQNNGTLVCEKHDYVSGVCSVCNDVCGHSGEATCKTAAICAVCGLSYTNADNHETNEFIYAVNKSDSTKHDKIYACCEGVATTEDHATTKDENKATCLQQAVCDTCGVSYGEVNPDNHDKDTYTNGFSDCCDAYQSATLNADGIYEIYNAGQLLWFAELVNSGSTNANGQLMSDIDMTGISIWAHMNEYGGTFDGSGFSIIGLNKNAGVADEKRQGFIANLVEGGIVKNLTFENASVFDKSSVGTGIIAYNNAGTISGCFIKNCDINLGNYKGLGFIAGQNLNGGVIENCAAIDSTATRRYGGSSSQSIGGITEVNNGTVRNCYTYGCAFKNGTSANGAIISTGSAPENSFYYTTSTVADTFGTAKTDEQFASGEVAYLLNGGKSDETVIWRHTIGEDTYPSFTGEIVLYDENADPKYYNEKTDVISVNISWGAMEFTYTDGEWLPESHTYADGKWTPDADGGNVITVKNNGTANVNVNLTYTKIVTEVNGSFTDENGSVIANSFLLAGEEEKKYKLELNGKPNSNLNNANIGSVTVTITLPDEQNT